jgi:hypothetical protein
VLEQISSGRETDAALESSVRQRTPMKTKVIGIRVDEGLWAQVHREAKASGVSTAWYVTEAVRERLGRLVVQPTAVVRHGVVRPVVQPKDAADLTSAAEKQLEKLRLQEHYREHPEDAPQ